MGPFAVDHIYNYGVMAWKHCWAFVWGIYPSLTNGIPSRRVNNADLFENPWLTGDLIAKTCESVGSMSNRCGSDGLCANEWKMYFPTGLCFTTQYKNSSPVSDKNPQCCRRFNLMPISKYYYTCKVNCDSIINSSWIWPPIWVLRLFDSFFMFKGNHNGCVFQLLTVNTFFLLCLNTGSYRHYNDVIMSAMASQTTGISIVYSVVISGADQRKHQAPRHWPLCGEFTGDRWIPRTKGQ